MNLKQELRKLTNDSERETFNRIVENEGYEVTVISAPGCDEMILIKW